jgi:hypothetical protein
MPDTPSAIAHLVLDCIEALDEHPERNTVVTMIPGRYDLELVVRRTPA